MTKRLLICAAFSLLVPGQGGSQSHTSFPVDISAGPPPQGVMADGKRHFLYELRLTNFSAKPIELTALDVLGGEGTSPLASYRGEALEKLLMAVGPDDTKGKARAISGGRTVEIFLDVTQTASAHLPIELRHRLSLSIAGNDGTSTEKTVDNPTVAVRQDPVPVLRAPLNWSGWVAANALTSTDHRRALVPVDGKERIAQRFAIDWIRLGPDGRLFHGDPNSNVNFYGYGAEVVAVADGRVSDLLDGIPDNIGRNERSNRSITLENVVGNYVILDLGRRHFALYAHLQPGGLKVKLGDQVKAGQVLALLGNTGNSDAPHLHFHLMDANSPLASEGLPYELESFTEVGVIDLPGSLDAGKAWRPKTPETPIIHRHEFPMDNVVVNFP